MKHWTDTERERLFAEAQAREAEAIEAYRAHVEAMIAPKHTPLSRAACRDARGPLYRGAMRIVEAIDRASVIVLILAAAWLVPTIIIAIIGV